ncbi:uncharacterized protein SETTUDRAFT_122843 [Exserohilum turcica Et28A]|uniref:DUF1989 domain-containing protein n=1 Tax=Exserohilum turcicum (strain 28A) TaxID=671987 RepID=R0I6P8_EXST2|nr:uncharacterized protein SETTUDRAFT_122843 [Exserohilum turcica Et28A]EOA81265.1 hypothetical protein SETTUDRAFT_122843 [Exserohilum turcica Et28A]
MSGELQTIPARHGVATFVPRGRTIKVINTYGKQVVSMWAFTLGPPPEEGEGMGEGEVVEKEVGEEEVRREAEGLKMAVEEEGKKEDGMGSEGGKEKSKDDKESEDSKQSEKGAETQPSEDKTNETTQDAKDLPKQTPDAPEPEKTAETTTSSSQQPVKRTWASYLPSIPYRNKGTATKQEVEQKPSPEQEKKQNEENTKKWSSYLPTGKSFSSYVPNVEVPDSKSVLSAFKASHYRDPNKSYAEQLYDFSKTPVGAGTMAAATGSGYASSVYAAYSAYASMHPSNSSQPPMEYLSLPHTRTASHKLVPEVNDELLTNLRNPIMTLIEDTSPGAHDTLTAACDANQYAALGVEKPAEHGSCAENLVLALKEINETSGLKGTKAVGADITVNIAPTPLHLFMNAPLDSEGPDQSDGAGAKGVTLRVEEPQGTKRCFVRFRAERDIVVVFSACPMDVGKQNGGRCMASNFMVEDLKEGEDLASSISSDRTSRMSAKHGQKEKVEQQEKDDKQESEKPHVPNGLDKNVDKEKDAVPEQPKPRKKPKKLQVRSQPAPTPA